MILKEVENDENSELIKNSLIRAKSMELVAVAQGLRKKHLEYFLSGLLSSLDLILNKPMEELIKDMPLTEDVKDALLKKNNSIRRSLDYIICYEQGEWDKLIGDNSECSAIENKELMNIYIKAIHWNNGLEF